MPTFSPLLPNCHLSTIAASLWPRRLDVRRFAVETRYFQTTPDTQVLVRCQQPVNPAQADVILVHGLEGSSESGYMRSMAQALLEAGFAVHRFNLRNCGGTEHLTPGVYHAGLTADLLAYVKAFHPAAAPYLVGFSLGGNVVLKLAGELEQSGSGFLRGICAVSTPIDLRVSCERIRHPSNRMYDYWFLRSLKDRIRKKCTQSPGLFPVRELSRLRSLYEFDDRVTAPLSGFRDAEHYYETQSAVRFLSRIRIPTVLIQAMDDPLIPFDVFSTPAITVNPHINLLATRNGGHLGFLARSAPRWWLDAIVVRWIMEKEQNLRLRSVPS